jgi:hypothetical protein
VSDINEKDFWGSKEGTWGMIVGLIAFCLVGWGLVTMAPLILAGFAAVATMLGAGMALLVGGIALTAVVYATIIDPSLRNLVMLKYKMFIRGLRTSIIDQNPITILKMWKTKAQERMKDIRDSKDLVSKQKTAVSKTLQSFKDDFIKFQSQAKVMNGDPERQAQFNSACGNMATAAEMVKKTAGQLDMVSRQYKKIDDAYKDLELMYADMEYQETVLVRDFEVSGALDQVWTKMRSIFKGENEWDQMRAEAVDSINNKYAERMGRVDSAIDDCQGKFDDMKLQQEVKVANGVDMFNQLSGMNVDQLATVTTARPAIAYQKAEVMDVATGTRSYADLIRK